MSTQGENGVESSNPHNPASPSISADVVDMELEKCEDVDLLSVSCKLAHLSLDVIGECLGLQESQVQDALSRVSDRHQDHNKVHLLLMKWREVNGDGATWGALIQCLQSLPEIADNIQGEFIFLVPVLFLHLITITVGRFTMKHITFLIETLFHGMDIAPEEETDPNACKLGVL